MSGLMVHELFHNRLISFFAPFCLILLLLASLTNAAPAHYLKASVTNNLKDSSKCLGPGWTDKLQWAIKSGECNSGGAFTPVSCVNDQTKTINPGETIQAANCELNELPAGNYEIYCIRVIWCQKEPKVRGLFKLNTDGINPVENKPPVAVAKAGFYPEEVSKEVSIKLGEGMRFFSSGSSDPDGSITKYSWDYGDGKTDSSKDASHRYSSPGKYSVKLTVTDDKGATATDTISVTITQPRLADARAGITSSDISKKEVSIKSGETVYLDGSKSISGKKIVKYSWFSRVLVQKKDYSSEKVSDQFTYTCQLEAICSYRAYLTVVDETGLQSIDAVDIKVARDPSVKPPVAVLLVGPAKDNVKSNKVTVDEAMKFS